MNSIQQNLHANSDGLLYVPRLEGYQEKKQLGTLSLTWARCHVVPNMSRCGSVTAPGLLPKLRATKPLLKSSTSLSSLLKIKPAAV